MEVVSWSKAIQRAMGTIREYELRQAAIIQMQVAAAAFDAGCLTVKTRFM